MENKEIEIGDELLIFHSFLESLKDKTVTIYRGGPESRTGKLLDVQSDYVTLHAQDKKNSKIKTVVYYQILHVKSISEDSKTNSLQGVEPTEEEVEFFKAENFNGLIEQLVGEKVKLNLGGPESKKGTLLRAVRDHLVLYTADDGIVYFNIHHVKSISLDVKVQKEEANDAAAIEATDIGAAETAITPEVIAPEANSPDVQEEPEIVYPEFLMASDFQDVFRNMAHKWVAINRGGPEAMEGVLVENVGGHYTLVSNQEILRIHPFHIRSISSGPKGSLKQDNQNTDNNESTNSDANTQAANQAENAENSAENKSENKNEDKKDNKDNKDDNKKDNKNNNKDDNKKDNKTDNKKDSKKDNKEDDTKNSKKNGNKEKNKEQKKEKRSKTKEKEYVHVPKKRNPSDDVVVKSIDYVWKTKASAK